VKRFLLTAFVFLFVGFLALCVLAPVTLFAKNPVLRMATTTSTDNTGLLDILAPVFQKDTGIELQWVAVGTGKALALGQNCDVDILMVHAPDAERKFVNDGFGVDRKEFMYNDFIIIGPKSDPARIAGKSVQEALTRIESSSAPFASRGDDSGTNKLEISLWKSSGFSIPDRESWYIQTGQGMIATIIIAEERDAYTLTDRVLNQYSVIAINPERCPSAQYELAIQFVDWITSDKTQQLIGDFKLLGKQLFTPNAE